ncbi:MAG: hypothetical protein IPJ65_19300 [Archangiaceae bacterium]|nr:hypothetical protein [Archangiaceae bacterium]
MSQSELPPLPDDLRRMLAELPGEAPSADVEARMFAAIGAALAPTAAATATAAGAKAGASASGASAVGAGVAKYVVAAFIAGAVAGGGAHAVLAPTPVRVVTAPLPIAVAPEPAVAREPVIEPPPPPTAPAPEAPRRVKREPKVEAAAPAPGHLGEERRLLDAARTALREGKPDRALTVLEQHLQGFERGELAEEREAMRVQALMSLQRVAEARLLAAEFRARYPGSMFLPVIDEATRETK